ncbi:hypothetical protein GCM10010429_49790 [Micromonospora olivasterospora]|uniref:DDE superfamily endonuclease n=1 Tax=Micromonospora olivasterospora TaxID=1880 RepID=A0A562IK86_MICOL|nr:hypothetical protein JD77_06128 [Micromonospora olivasterospora]
MRQIGPLFGVSHSAAHRVIDTLDHLLTLAPVRRRPVDQVAIVDGTLNSDPGPSPRRTEKNYRYSTNLQVASDTSTRLAIAVGDPQPGNHNDAIAYRTRRFHNQSPAAPTNSYRVPILASKYCTISSIDDFGSRLPESSR